MSWISGIENRIFFAPMPGALWNFSHPRLTSDAAWGRRTHRDLQQTVALPADRLADSVTVLRSPLERPQGEHVERVWKEFPALVVGVLAIVLDTLGT
jgi:hypothetical protein